MSSDQNNSLLEIDEELLDELQQLIALRDDGALRALLIDLHEADIAQLLEFLPEENRHYILGLLNQNVVGEVILHLPEQQREDFFSELEPEDITRIVEELSTDDATDIVSELPDDVAEQVLQNLSVSDKEATEEIRGLLQFGEDTAGGRMTTDYVAVGPHETVAASIEKIRSFARETELDVYVLYVVDDHERLIGIVRLQDLVLYPSEEVVRRFMIDDVITVSAGEDQAVVAQVMQRYDLVAVPVIADDNVLLGIITFDDIADIIDDETSEDMLYLAGVTDEDSLSTPPLVSIRRRMPWLVINLGAAFLTSTVVAQFEGTISKLAVLAALMPVVGGMGGNAAIQSITVVIRSIALGELGSSSKARAITKETIVGLLNGLVMGVGAGLVVWFMWEDYKLGIIIAVAMQVNLLIAGVAGSVVPLVLRKLKFDPALSSGPLVTMLTDISGFVMFLGLATLAISWLLP